MASLLATGRRTLTDAEVVQALKELDTYGYTHIAKYLSPPLVKSLLTRVIELSQAHMSDPTTQPDEWRAEWIFNLQNKDSRFIDLLIDASIEKLLMPKLNDPWFRHLPVERPNYILGQFVARSPNHALLLHMDAGMPTPGPETTMIQMGYMLEDSNVENGCTLVVPGSHLLGRYSDRDMVRKSPIQAKAGDLVVWDGRVWHGTTENRSRATRWSIVATFQRWWVKQSFDIPRALPETIYRRLSFEQKALLGFLTIPPRDETERITRVRPVDDIRDRPQDYYK